MLLILALAYYLSEIKLYKTKVNDFSSEILATHTLETRCTLGNARIFFCTHKTYLYAQNEISYEYIQILF